MNKKKILITGAGGRIGSVICPILSESYDLRFFDTKKLKAIKKEEVFIGDILDIKSLQSAMEDIDVVIHLAAISDEDDFVNKILPINIQGTYNILESAKNSKVKKVILASTIQTIWNYPNNKVITTDMPARPFNIYACSKLFGENIGRYYSEKYGLSVICLRIGYFLPYDHEWLQDTEKRKSWCSQKDLIQIINKCIDNNDLGYEIFFAISENENAYLDINNLKKKINYESIDGVKNSNKSFEVKNYESNHEDNL
jgi:uronate dehydrogenase